ncbi:hypothetical protein Q3G72_022440 [Acer saccharum]|nr:hypothetical protein Q3G72_022440 [Acer saccharum]
MPCKKDKSPNTITTTHFDRLLAESSASADYCTTNGKVPLLSLTALHHLHIFIFVLAVVHVTFCALTILFGGAKVKVADILMSKITISSSIGFRVGKSYSLVGWLLLLAVGTKLEHIINQLAHDIAEKHVAVEGPSDDHFWFQRPKIIVLLIHIILFQSSFELPFFFWIWGCSVQTREFGTLVRHKMAGKSGVTGYGAYAREVAVEKELAAMSADGNVRNQNRFSEHRFGATEAQKLLEVFKMGNSGRNKLARSVKGCLLFPELLEMDLRFVLILLKVLLLQEHELESVHIFQL